MRLKNKFFDIIEDLEPEDEEAINDFIQSLNLPFEGEFKGDEYTVALKDSNEFSKVYNIISTNDDLNLRDGSTANDNEARFLFYKDDYEIGLLADFDDDIYRLVVYRV